MQSAAFSHGSTSLIVILLGEHGPSGRKRHLSARASLAAKGRAFSPHHSQQIAWANGEPSPDTDFAVPGFGLERGISKRAPKSFRLKEAAPGRWDANLRKIGGRCGALFSENLEVTTMSAIVLIAD
jgi:hypothetical protein